MNHLNEQLELIVSKLKKHRSLYEQNEMAVRDQIVNPILRYLGWDPENPDEVQPNVYTEEGIPDYSLIKNGKKILFIEAKKLGVDVEKKEVFRQLAKYSFNEGTRYGVLTNGAIWVLVKSFEEGTTLAERIIWKIDLETEEFSAVIRKLVGISKTNIEQIEVLVKKANILEEIWISFLDQPEEMIKGLLPVVRGTISQNYPNYSFEDTEIVDLLRERIGEVIPESSVVEAPEQSTEPGGIPRRIELKGEVVDIHNSFEILVHTANWLIKNGKLKSADCPVIIGRGKRNLINNVSKHKYGDDFRAPKELANKLWIETNYSTASCIYNARRLLEKFGISSDSLKIK